jgi:MFS family permease
MILAAAWAVLGMSIALWSEHLPMLAVAVFLVGMAGAPFNLARQSYLAEVIAPTYRARAMSTLGGTLRVGALLGPFAASAAMVPLGLDGAYWVGLAAMVLALAVSWWIPELVTHERDGQRLTETQSEALVPSPGKISVWSVAKQHARVFGTVGIGVVLLSGVRAARVAVVPLWTDAIGLDASVAALMYGLSGLVEVLVFYPAGKVMDQRGRVFVAVPCLALMGLALLLLPFTHGVASLSLVAMLLGFGNGIGSGIVMTLGADYAPASQRPQFLGIWRLGSDMGIMSLPLILSAVTAVAGLATGIWVVCGAAWAGALILGLFIPCTPRQA